MRKRVFHLFLAAFIVSLLTACTPGRTVILPKDGMAAGGMGDIISYEDVDIPQTALQTLLPSEYTLQAGESRTGLLLFEVPAGDTEFVISYIAYFDHATPGDTFRLSVTPTRR